MLFSIKKAVVIILSCSLPLVPAQFNINQGLRNPGNRHYFRGEESGYRINGELMGNGSYPTEYNAWLQTFTLCRLDGQDIPGTGWRATCARNLIAKSISSAVLDVYQDTSYANPANMRVVDGPNEASALKYFVLSNFGQGPACGNADATAASCSTPGGPQTYLNNAMDYQVDMSSSSRRKIKVTCKKACGGVGALDPPTMDSLIQNNLVPVLRNNLAMGAVFAFSRASDQRIYARCRLTIAGEIWYSQTTGCPDAVPDSSATTGQF